MRRTAEKSRNQNRSRYRTAKTRISASGKQTASVNTTPRSSPWVESETGIMSGLSERSAWLWGTLIFAFFLLIYWRTCCRTVFWWDSAEFVSAVATLGIPHPPSFPLYILLGKLFSFLPLLSLPFKLNLLSGVFAAFSLSFFALVFLKLLRTFFSELAVNRKMLFLVLPMGLFIAGLNFAFWIQGVRAEVYSLNGLIFILLFFCGLNHLAEHSDEQKTFRWLYLFFFIFGLGMGNHNVTLLSTLPAFVYLFLTADSAHLLKAKKLGGVLTFFLLGCSIYLFLPLRAINGPALNWGNPDSLPRVLTAALALKSAKQIGFALDHTLLERIRDAWTMIYSQLTLLPFLLSLTGFFFLLKKHFKFFIFFLLVIVGNSATIIILPSEFISTSLDFQGYILPLIFSFSLAFGLGVLFLLRSIYGWIAARNFSPGFSKSLAIVFSVFFFCVSLLPFTTTYRQADLSENDLAYTYGKSVLSQLDASAVVVIDNPNLYFILSALKYAEGYRKDVSVLDRGLLQAEWNLQQERKNYPRLFSDIEPDLRREQLVLKVMTEGLNRNLPVYLEYTENDSDLANFLSPAGYLYIYSKKARGRLPSAFLKNQRDFENAFSLQGKAEAFQQDADALRMFVYISYRWGLYYEQKGMLEDALRNFSSALELDPSSPELQTRVETLKNRLQLAKN